LIVFVCGNILVGWCLINLIKLFNSILKSIKSIILTSFNKLTSFKKLPRCSICQIIIEYLYALFTRLINFIKNNIVRIRIFGGFTSLILIIHRYGELFKDLGLKTILIFISGSFIVILYENIPTIIFNIRSFLHSFLGTYGLIFNFIKNTFKHIIKYSLNKIKLLMYG